MLEASSFLLRSLLDDGRITPQEAKQATDYAAAKGMDAAEALVALKIVGSRQLSIDRAKTCEYPYFEISSFEIDIRNARLLPRKSAEQLGAFPLFCADGVATVGMEDPLNLQSIDAIRRMLRQDVDPVICDPQALRGLIARAYSLSSASEEKTDSSESDGDKGLGDEPIVAAVNQMIIAAVDQDASDIHLSPDEAEVHLRYRIDGVLQSQQSPAKSVHAALIQRLKVMSKLDLTQARRPQDGKFRFNHDGQQVDIRLSLVPTIHGENAVLRLLRPARLGSVVELGMPALATANFEEMIKKPHGMLLVTGPTGSGKTTTLYTAIAQINTPDRSIMTIEDPVEVRLPLVRQVQTHPEIGLDFATALRSILRQDPDVILVGEIRDEETAKIASQAALTGHLVFSTLHTNTAIGSISRLRSFGIPSFTVAHSILGVVGQRLIRRVCEHCRTPDPVNADLRASLGIGPNSGMKFVTGRGCPRCLSTGYRGRLGVYELVKMSSKLQTLIECEATESEMNLAAAHDGTRPMLDDGIEKAAMGLTSFSELSRLAATVSTEIMLPEEPRMSA